MGQTSNYGLSQPACWEQPSRSDWCGDMAAIDEALAEKSALVAGCYSGNEASSQTISLGFSPSAVLVVSEDGVMGANANSSGGLALSGHPSIVSRDRAYVVNIIPDGFVVYHEYDSRGSITSNLGVHHYLALR